MFDVILYPSILEGDHYLYQVGVTGTSGVIKYTNLKLRGGGGGLKTPF